MRYLFLITTASVSIVYGTSLNRRDLSGPAQQSELDEILIRMRDEINDEGGNPRVIPSIASWGTDTEDIPQLVQQGFIRGGNPSSSGELASESFKGEIYRGKHSGVYLLNGHNDEWVIKYHRFCPSQLDPIEPILVEAWFLKQLESIPDLTNKVIYYSGPIDEPQGESSVDGLSKRWTKIIPNPAGYLCRDKSVPIVRYIITTIVGRSVEEFARSEYFSQGLLVPVTTALSIGISMVQLLQRLHEKANSIHGDVHPGNFAGHPKLPQLVLLDFGRARVINLGTDFLGDDGEFQTGNRGLVSCDAVLSQWESMMYKPSFRDDVYRAFMVMAYLIHGTEYVNAITSICSAVKSGKEKSRMFNQYSLWKSEGNIFDSGVSDSKEPSLDPEMQSTRFNLDTVLPQVDEASRAAVRTHFKNALDILRSTQINERPRYNDILSELWQISSTLASSTGR